MAYALLTISKNIKLLEVMQILLLFSHITSKPFQGPHLVWTAYGIQLLSLLPKGSSAPDPVGAVLDFPIS